MRIRIVIVAFLVFVFSGVLVRGQGTVVVNDPTTKVPAVKLSPSVQSLLDHYALPKIKAAYQTDICDVNLEPAGIIRGPFTRPGAKQSLVFLQICQTGNGLGVAGLILIENEKIAGIYGSDGGWTTGISVVPDINRNGLDEFVLAYSGGLHQGQGGVGVDLVEFSNGVPVGIGWYQSEKFDDTNVSTAWKLTAKPRKVPVFYRQKFTSGDGGKWRGGGLAKVFKPGEPISKFTVVK